MRHTLLRVIPPSLRGLGGHGSVAPGVRAFQFVADGPASNQLSRIRPLIAR